MTPARHASDGGAAPRPGASALSAAALVAALVVCAVALSAFQSGDYDTWLHLAIGRHVVETHSVPHTDPFSHTVPGAPWVAHEWLSGVLFLLIERLGGTPALVGLRIALVLSFLGAWLMLCRGRPGAVWGVGLLAPFAFGFGPRFLIRPFLFSSALLLWQFVIVDAALRRGKRWAPWLLPPLYVLWINLHSGAVVGWVFLLVYVVGLHLQSLWRTGEGGFERSDMAHLLPHQVARLYPFLGASAVAMLINPNHIRAVLFPLLLLPRWVQGIEEHASTFSHLEGYSVINRLGVFALVVMVTWAISFGRLHLGANLALLLATGLALWRIRNVVDAGLLAVALIGPAFGEWLAAEVRRLAPRVARSAPAGERRLGALLTAASVLLALSAATLWFPRSESYRFGLGTNLSRYPAAAMDFLERTRPEEGTGFHPPEWGGALLWRFGEQVKVYVDGRLEIYGRDFLANDYARVALAHEQEPSWSQILERRGVTWILLSRGDRNTQPLAQALYRRQDSQSLALRDWALVHFDDTALVFYRRGAFDEARWAELALGFRADVEWMRGLSAAQIQVHPEWRERLLAIVDAEPDNRLAVELLRAAAEKIDDRGQLAFALERLLTFDLPRDARGQAEHLMGLLRFREGEFEASLEHLTRARRLAPESVAVALDRAAALWSLRREAETVAAYREALALDPTNAQAREALAEHEAGTLWADHPGGALPANP